MGGINPPIAQDFHRKNIEQVVNDCLNESRMTFADIDAIAVTNRPGNLAIDCVLKMTPFNNIVDNFQD